MRLERFYMDDDLMHYSMLHNDLFFDGVPSRMHVIWLCHLMDGIGVSNSCISVARAFRLMEYLCINGELPGYRLRYCVTKYELGNFVYGVIDFVTLMMPYYNESVRSKRSNKFILTPRSNSIWRVNYATFERSSRLRSIKNWFKGYFFFLNKKTEFLLHNPLYPISSYESFFDLVSFCINIAGILFFAIFLRYDWMMHTYNFTFFRTLFYFFKKYGNQWRIRPWTPQRFDGLRSMYYYHIIRTQFGSDSMTFVLCRYFYISRFMKFVGSYYKLGCVRTSVIPLPGFIVPYTILGSMAGRYKVQSRLTRDPMYNRSYSVQEYTIRHRCDYEYKDPFSIVYPFAQFGLGTPCSPLRYLAFGSLCAMYGYIKRFKLAPNYYNRIVPSITSDLYLLYRVVLRIKYQHYYKSMFSWESLITLTRNDLFYFYYSLRKCIGFRLWKFYITFEGIDRHASRGWFGYSSKRTVKSEKSDLWWNAASGRFGYLVSVLIVSFRKIVWKDNFARTKLNLLSLGKEQKMRRRDIIHLVYLALSFRLFKIPAHRTLMFVQRFISSHNFIKFNFFEILMCNRFRFGAESVRKHTVKFRPAIDIIFLTPVHLMINLILLSRWVPWRSKYVAAEWGLIAQRWKKPVLPLNVMIQTFYTTYLFNVFKIMKWKVLFIINQFVLFQGLVFSDSYWRRMGLFGRVTVRTKEGNGNQLLTHPGFEWFAYVASYQILDLFLAYRWNIWKKYFNWKNLNLLPFGREQGLPHLRLIQLAYIAYLLGIFSATKLRIRMIVVTLIRRNTLMMRAYIHDLLRSGKPYLNFRLVYREWW